MRIALLNIFNASQPVVGRGDLWGRRRETERLLDAVVGQRMHALVYGPRGSGKTSLARVFGDYADEANVLVIYESAGRPTSFAALMRPFLAQLPIDPDSAAGLASDFDSRAFAQRLAEVNGVRIVLILDEFDRVEDAAVRHEVANLMKLLSDMRVESQLVLVGIARNIGDLLEGHPSLRRHLIGVAVGPVSDRDIDALIDSGTKRVGMGYDEEARVLVRAAALGSPYHARLLCLKAGLAAIARGDTVVRIAAMRDGIEDAFADWAEMTSPMLAQTFTRLARTGRAGRFAAVAGHAARQGTLRFALGSSDAGFEAELFGPLAPHLVEVAAGEWAFADPLAPQFLQASVILARAEIGQPHRAPAHLTERTG